MGPKYAKAVEQAIREDLETRGYVGLLCRNEDYDNPFGPAYWEPGGGGYTRVALQRGSLNRRISFLSGPWGGRVTHAAIFDRPEPRTGRMMELVELWLPRTILPWVPVQLNISFDIR